VIPRGPVPLALCPAIHGKWIRSPHTVDRPGNIRPVGAIAPVQFYRNRADLAPGTQTWDRRAWLLQKPGCPAARPGHGTRQAKAEQRTHHAPV